MSETLELLPDGPLAPVTPLKAQALAGDGALLIDIRAAEEFAQARIPGAENRPLASIGTLDSERAVVFLCRTGRRCMIDAQRLAGLCRGEAFRLEGGIEAWREAGLPLAVERGEAMELDQQALVLNGSLVILSALFAVIVSPWYFLLAVAVGVSLIVEGVKGRSGAETLLRKLPWNR